jgi:hypothetical protein
MGYNILAHTYIKKSNIRFLKSLGSQLQVVNTLAPIDTPNRHPGGCRFSFSRQRGLIAPPRPPRPEDKERARSQLDALVGSRSRINCPSPPTCLSADILPFPAPGEVNKLGLSPLGISILGVNRLPPNFNKNIGRETRSSLSLSLRIKTH